jgi:hypothetical protein
MRTHQINNNIYLQFKPVNENFYPQLVHKKDVINVPLLIAHEEIDIILEKITLINFMNLPVNYIRMIIAGCISIVLKYSNNNNN